MNGSRFHSVWWRRTAGAWAIAALCILLVPRSPAVARQSGATVALRGTPLADALQLFVDRTGRSVAYDPGLVTGLRSYCVTTESEANALLACILEGTGLEFFTRASGTFVVGPTLQLPERYGLITGRVLDGSTSAPLPGAHVLLADAGRGAAADRTGRFAIDQLLPGRYALAVTHVGYRTWRDTLTVEPSGRTAFSAVLGPDPLNVAPIVVESDRGDLDPWLADAATASPESAALARAAPVGERLAGRSGVTLSDVTADIRVEGGRSGDVALRLDGVPLLLPRSLASFIGPLGAPALDRIDVRRAGFEAGAGSRLGAVLDFRHALVGPGRLDLQVDPYAVSGRARLAHASPSGRQWHVLASVRHGLDRSIRPAAINDMLQDWSAPDPFLLVAPLRRYQLATPQILDTAFGASIPGVPDLGYDDLHLAARLKTRPTSSWDASLHHGTRSLSGSRMALGESTQAGADAPLFSSADAYDWRSTMAQVRHETVLGSSTFLEVQVWTTHYGMDHRYRLAEQIGVLQDEASFRTQSVETDGAVDDNTVYAWGLKANATVARGRHQVAAGLEALSTTTRFDLRLASVVEGSLTETLVVDPTYTDGGIADLDTTSVFAVRHAQVTSRSSQPRAAAYASDRVALGALVLEPGARLTYLPDRATVYVEPRLRASYAWARAPAGPVTATVSAGLYRQFESQLDVSTLNAGSFFPSTRIWLPTDASVRPPHATHVRSSVGWQFVDRWTARVDGWWKRIGHDYAFNYAMNPRVLQEGARLDQADLLTPVTGDDRGVGVALAYRAPSAWGTVRYEDSRSTRRSAALFGGREVSTPGHAPQRLTASMDWSVARATVLGARFEHAWGRTWAFRQAYYDYFGHDPATSGHGEYDLSDPDAHRLPALTTLDLSASHVVPIGPAELHLRAEVRNVLDRRNEADRQLLWNGSTLAPVARHYAGRVIAGAVRVVW